MTSRLFVSTVHGLDTCVIIKLQAHSERLVFHFLLLCRNDGYWGVLIVIYELSRILFRVAFCARTVSWTSWMFGVLFWTLVWHVLLDALRDVSHLCLFSIFIPPVCFAQIISQLGLFCGLVLSCKMRILSLESSDHPKGHIIIIAHS